MNSRNCLRQALFAFAIVTYACTINDTSTPANALKLTVPFADSASGLADGWKEYTRIQGADDAVMQNWLKQNTGGERTLNKASKARKGKGDVVYISGTLGNKARWSYDKPVDQLDYPDWVKFYNAEDKNFYYYNFERHETREDTVTPTAARQQRQFAMGPNADAGRQRGQTRSLFRQLMESYAVHCLLALIGGICALAWQLSRLNNETGSQTQTGAPTKTP